MIIFEVRHNPDRMRTHEPHLDIVRKAWGEPGGEADIAWRGAVSKPWWKGGGTDTIEYQVLRNSPQIASPNKERFVFAIIRRDQDSRRPIMDIVAYPQIEHLDTLAEASRNRWSRGPSDLYPHALGVVRLKESYIFDESLFGDQIPVKGGDTRFNRNSQCLSLQLAQANYKTKKKSEKGETGNLDRGLGRYYHHWRLAAVETAIKIAREQNKPLFIKKLLFRSSQEINPNEPMTLKPQLYEEILQAATNAGAIVAENETSMIIYYSE
ncbi:MAG: hypothetical protein HY394_06615 [Candidatus Diapherotrites archaeon]|nr:hypothetical protein [Candidatus Diapherotrites archaeon]